MDQFEKDQNDMSNVHWFSEKWNWLAWVDALANGKRKDWEYFLKMNVLEFLTSVSFYQDKMQQQREHQARMDGITLR